jgi:hypothetical protein
MELLKKYRIGIDCLLVAREETVIESEFQRPRGEFRLLILMPN